MSPDPVSLVCQALDAFVRSDRGLMESLLAPDYRFTSPLDNGLDRDGYFSVCWPNSGHISAFDRIETCADGEERAFVIYEGRSTRGGGFRNVEVHTARDGQLVSTEVYFGWSLPHPVAPGEHVDPAESAR